MDSHDSADDRPIEECPRDVPDVSPDVPSAVPHNGSNYEKSRLSRSRMAATSEKGPRWNWLT
jgi:hypothetical protein